MDFGGYGYEYGQQQVMLERKVVTISIPPHGVRSAGGPTRGQSPGLSRGLFSEDVDAGVKGIVKQVDAGAKGNVKPDDIKSFANEAMEKVEDTFEDIYEYGQDARNYIREGVKEVVEGAEFFIEDPATAVREGFERIRRRLQNLEQHAVERTKQLGG